MHEIEAWLQAGKGWHQGLMLYSKYGRFESVLGTMQAMGENHTTKKSLEEHLRKELIFLQSEQTAALPREVGTTTHTTHSVPNVPTVPVEPGELQLSANKLYAQMGATHARLLAVDTDAARKKLVDQLLSLQSEWAALMYEIKNGHPPVKPTKKVTKAKQLAGSEYQELCLLRSKVSRALNEQIPAYEEKLKEKEDKKLRKKLKARKQELASWQKRITELESGTDG